eukprot:1137058-Karenia_brevis.AAC.1
MKDVVSQGLGPSQCGCLPQGHASPVPTDALNDFSTQGSEPLQCARLPQAHAASVLTDASKVLTAPGLQGFSNDHASPAQLDASSSQ